MVRNLKEKVMEIVFLAAALASIVAVALICIFLFQSGLPAMKEIGLADFLFGQEWRPGNHLFGIFPMIVGSIYVTAGAILIGVPIGLFMAVYLAMYCPAKVYKVLKPAVDLLAGIPSIVYGFFGMVVIVPAVRYFFNEVIDLNGKGDSILTASIVLGIMILPTIIGAAEPAIRAVPKMYYEGALALLMADKPYIKDLKHISQMGQETMVMVVSSVDAFVEKDLEKAKEVLEHDDLVDNLFDEVKKELIELIHQNMENGEQAADLLMVAKYFERIGDHATNIAEWVIYSITGEHDFSTKSKENVTVQGRSKHLLLRP